MLICVYCYVYIIFSAGGGSPGPIIVERFRGVQARENSAINSIKQFKTVRKISTPEKAFIYGGLRVRLRNWNYPFSELELPVLGIGITRSRNWNYPFCCKTGNLLSENSCFGAGITRFSELGLPVLYPL